MVYTITCIVVDVDDSKTKHCRPIQANNHYFYGTFIIKFEYVHNNVYIEFWCDLLQQKFSMRLPYVTIKKWEIIWLDNKPHCVRIFLIKLSYSRYNTRTTKSMTPEDNHMIHLMVTE